jgi:hypothetical protein
MSDRNDRTSDEKHICTCQGTCKGVDGLGARWQCALQPPPPPLAVGQEVWVRAKICSIKPKRDGYADVEILDHYYYADTGEASDLEDPNRIRVPVSDLRLATE